jgi:hypothetical protein
MAAWPSTAGRGATTSPSFRSNGMNLR